MTPCPDDWRSAIKKAEDIMDSVFPPTQEEVRTRRILFCLATSETPKQFVVYLNNMEPLP